VGGRSELESSSLLVEAKIETSGNLGSDKAMRKMD
jgi:hypothetical protein